MAKAVGIDLGTTNSVVAFLKAGEPTVIANAEGAHHALGRRLSKSGEVLVGEVAKRQAITNPDRTIRSVKRHMGTTWHDQHRRQGLLAPGDLRPHPAEAEEGRRGLSSGHRHPGRHHRAGLLRRRPAHRHQRGRPDRRPRGPADHQRAHRGRPGLRPGQREAGADHPRLRPRRRHVRRVGAGDQRRHLPGEVHQRQHPPRRRRLGPAGHRLAGEDVQGHRGRRPVQRQDGAAAAEGSGGEGQDRALRGAGDQRSTCRSSRPPARAPSTST